MKIKVTILTAFMVCLILLAFDSFIYSTLSKHLLDMEGTLLSNKAQSIAQYYTSYLTDDEAKINPNAWVSRYTEQGQTVVLLNASGAKVAQTGNVDAAAAIASFRPVSTIHQDTISAQSSMLMVTEAPAVDQDKHHLLGYVLLVSKLKDVQAYMETLLTVLIIGSLGAVLVAAFGSYFISAAAVRPIIQLIRLIERIQANRLNERVQIPKGRDEVSRLAATFNSMLVRIERSFDQQARFVADASHEFRTPLTTIQGYADLLRRWGKDDPNILSKAILVIHKEADRLQKLANDLLTLASLEASSNDLPQRTAAATVVDEVVDALGLLNPDIVLVKTLEGSGDVSMAPAHLKQVLTNLLDNAIKHTPPKGRIQISVKSTSQAVSLVVQDDGPGIPAEDLPYIFERFYRVDKARGRRGGGGGTGLGLAIVKGLVEMYGGQITIDSQVGQGTTVRIQLPLASPA